MLKLASLVLFNVATKTVFITYAVPIATYIVSTEQHYSR